MMQLIERLSGRKCVPRGVRHALLAGLAMAGAQCATAAETPLTVIRVATGLQNPLFVATPPGDHARLFIAEQYTPGANAAHIRILDLATGQLLATPFLTVSNVSASGEQGLLGLAFDPDYAHNGFFYVDYTSPPSSPGFSFIVRYRVSSDNPNVADATSAQTILRVAQPYSNHNGGWIAFGPDGYLYISFGDGGSAGDPQNRAQDITDQLLGKILRIDVHGPDAYPDDDTRNYAIPPTNPFVGINGDAEIWAYGLRNPWRCGFDRLTGDLWIGDVGQSQREEIDFQPAGVGGRNYGWKCMEGTRCNGTIGCTCNDPSLTLPIHEYTHTDGIAIVGGYVYRGCAIPDLQGSYFFADYGRHRTWTLRYDGSVVSGFHERTAELLPAAPLTLRTISSFGEDADGELYFCDLTGSVYKIVPSGIAPVLCPRPGDLNCDGLTNNFDVDPFLLAMLDAAEYAIEYPTCNINRADMNHDGLVNLFDIDGFLACIVDGVCP